VLVLNKSRETAVSPHGKATKMFLFMVVRKVWDPGRNLQQALKIQAEQRHGIREYPVSAHSAALPEDNPTLFAPPWFLFGTGEPL
jgi:hypothetical protein